MDRRRYLTEQLRRFGTLVELRHSAFYADCGAEIESPLDTPEVVAGSGAAPRLAAFVRVVQWNREKGIRLDEVLRQLETDEVLRWADVLLLNEADHGMIRSGNRHIAQCLAQALGMNMAFGTSCLELTQGVGAELALAGENRESLQGNAVLAGVQFIGGNSVCAAGQPGGCPHGAGLVAPPDSSATGALSGQPASETRLAPGQRAEGTARG